MESGLSFPVLRLTAFTGIPVLLLDNGQDDDDLPSRTWLTRSEPELFVADILKLSNTGGYYGSTSAGIVRVSLSS